MTISVRTTYGEGGMGLSGMGNAHHKPIADVLRGLIDDIAGQTTATIASPDAPAAAGVYTQADIQAMVTLLNEIKGALNTASATAKIVVKDAN